MSKIYICEGDCEGQSELPGVCQADVCVKKGQPLTEMNKCDKCGTIYGKDVQHSCTV